MTDQEQRYIRSLPAAVLAPSVIDGVAEIARLTRENADLKRHYGMEQAAMNKLGALHQTLKARLAAARLGLHEAQLRICQQQHQSALDVIGIALIDSSLSAAKPPERE